MTTCNVCQQEIQSYSGDGEHCSEFCIQATDEEKQKWVSGALKVGDFGVYPCKECGSTIEDELYENRFCGDSHCRLTRERKKTDALTDQLAAVTAERDRLFAVVSKMYTPEVATRLASGQES